MANQHPVTPPLKLVQEWREEAAHRQYGSTEADELIAEQAAQWGADQQLAKDAEWLDQHALDAPHLKITPVGESLKEAMRSKPPSLKEQALEVVTGLEKRWDLQCDLACLRRALEALPND
jgi:hypothetical protein